MKRKQLFCSCFALTLALSAPAQAAGKIASGSPTQDFRALMQPFAVLVQAFGAENMDRITASAAEGAAESGSHTDTADSPSVSASDTTSTPGDIIIPSAPAETPSAPADAAENNTSSDVNPPADNTSGTENSDSVEKPSAEPGNTPDSQPEIPDDNTQPSETPSDLSDDTTQPSETPSDADEKNPEQPDVPEQPTENTQNPALENSEDPTDIPENPEPSTDENLSDVPGMTDPDESENKPSEPVEVPSSPEEDIKPSEPDAETPVEVEKTEEPPVGNLPEEPTKEIPEELLPPEVVEIGDAPIINVVVPDTGNVVVNPYRLKVSAGDSVSTEQIIHNAQLLTSYSNVPVQVNASAIGSVPSGSDVIFVSEPPSKNAKDKAVFIYVEFYESPDGSTSAPWCGTYTGAENQLIVRDSDSEKQMVLTLPAGDESPSYGVYKLFGSATVNPSKMWTASDSIHVTVAFTFTPLESPEN